MNSRKRIGNYGEQKAAEFLEKNEYSIIERNFTCRQGEIDIIATKNEEIIFIEVKTRTHSFIEARLSIGSVKERHIWKTAEYYIYINRIEDVEIQFDAIEVYIEQNSWQINYIPKSIEK